MSFFSVFKRNKESYSLVINIGSGSVAGGIIKFTEKAGVDMVYYHHQSIPFQSKISITRHMELLKTTLLTLIHKIQTEGFKKINFTGQKIISLDRVFYIFSSPWSVSQTKIIKLKESKPIKLTEEYLARLVERQEKEFQSDIAKAGKIIERKIIQVRINGYAVDDFTDKSAKDLELSVFLTAVPEKILQLVSETITRTFHLKEAWCHSSTLAVFSTVRNIFPQKEDFILIDLSEELTDIFSVKNNQIDSLFSLPFGRNHFIRTLESNLDIPEELADSMIRLQTTQHNDQLASLKISVILDQAAAIWLEQITSTLTSLREKIYVPESVFLIADQGLNYFLKTKLEKQDLKVSVVDYKNLKSSVKVENTLFKLILMFLDKLYKI